MELVPHILTTDESLNCMSKRRHSPEGKNSKGQLLFSKTYTRDAGRDMVNTPLLLAPSVRTLAHSLLLIGWEMP